MSSSSLQTSPSLASTLPASWYTSDKIVDLARQHIYNKGWLFVSVITTFVTREEEATQFNFVDNPFFVVNDIEDVHSVSDITAYYGAYDVVMSDCETAEEKREKLKTLEKVNSYTTYNGLFFVCHQKTPSQTWSEFYGGKLEPIIDNFDFRRRPLRRRMSYECDYNFITFIDGYQECLHCTYTHPGLKKIFPLEFYKIENHCNFSRHYGSQDSDSKDCDSSDDDGLFLYFFPTTSLNVYGGGMGLFRCNPINGNKCRMEFDYYFEGSDEKFEEYFQFARQVAEEDIQLCEACQKNLQVGIYKSGILNPKKEAGVIYYQGLIRDRIVEGMKQSPIGANH